MDWFVSFLRSYGLGFLGNFLSLFVFCSLEEFRRISTWFFFLLTTFSNSVYLCRLTTEFLGIFNLYVYSNEFLQCRLNYFLQNVSRAISTYLAVGIALDRYIRSEWPISSRRICTRRNAMIYTLMISIVFSTFWTPWFSPSIVRNDITGDCIFNRSPSLYIYLTHVQTPFRFAMVCLLPVLIMSASNFRMLYNMRQSRRRVVNHRQTIRTVNPPPPSTFSSTNNPLSRRTSALDRMLFYMMLSNVFTFIFTQIPFNIYSTVRVYHPVLDSFTHSLVRALLLIWSSIYFGVAFYLYCLASPLFREKFRLISKKFFGLFKGQAI